MVEVPTLVFQSHINTSRINDNYGVDPNCIQISQVQLDPKTSQKTALVVSSQMLDNVVPQTVLNPVVQQTLSLDVFCHAATHPHTVHFAGHPEKKGLNPDLLLSKIKHVKGVSCVNPCLLPLLFTVSPMLSPDRV